MEQCVYTENGVPVYSYLNPYLHSFCLCLYVKAGSLYESEEENGITHLFEHVAIRNVDCQMKRKLYPLLDRLGLSLGGATYKEFVQFSMSGAVRHWKEAVDIFLRLLEPLCLTSRDIAIEKKRVEAEIREYGGKKSREAKIERAVWKGTSLMRPITGLKKNLKNMDLTSLVHFRESFFSRENLFFYVTGCCPQNGVGYLTGELEKKTCFTSGMRRENMADVPEKFFRRSPVPIIGKGEDTEVTISFDVDTSRYSDAALNLFFDMIFTGDNCPFYQEMSEKTGFIYSYEEQFERYKNIGNLQVSYQVAPAKLMDSFEKAMDIFKGLKKKPGDLSYVRSIYLDNGEMILDDADEFNWNRAYDCHILDENYPDIDSKKEAFRHVTEAQMKQMAREIFRIQNMTVVVKGDKKQISKKKLARKMERLES